MVLFSPCSQQPTVFLWLTLLTMLFFSKLVIIITVRSRLYPSVYCSREMEPWMSVDCETFPSSPLSIMKCLWYAQKVLEVSVQMA